MNNMHSIILNLLVLFSLTFVSVCSLIPSLKHYEVIESELVAFEHHSHSKRSVDSCDRTVTVTALGRTFKLRLWCKKGLLSSDFSVKYSHATSLDNVDEVNVNSENFWEGYVLNEKEKSHVDAYWEGRSLTATIITANDTFVIEPAWRHLSSAKVHSMIAYRASDLNELPGSVGGRFCGSEDKLNGSSQQTTEEESNNQPPQIVANSSSGQEPTVVMHERKKRDTSSSNTCPLLLVCDYSFFNTIANGDKAIAINYMISRIQFTDTIYRATDWSGNGLTGLGFEIQTIQVCTTPTAVSSGQTHFNMQTDTWSSANNLLSAFTANPICDSRFNFKLTEFCAAHLFHAHSFSDGTLGLAYIASPTPGQPGGICSSRGNTGWTSALNSNGARLLTLQASIITAHELGHNWGSQHDPAKCQLGPPGGNYIMYAYSVSGLDPNNDIFSDCSKANIYAVLQAKASCFVAKRTSLCGNTIVEPGEDCDGGSATTQGNDPCCTSACKFATNAKCSDINSVCCTNCLAASSTKVCQLADSSNITCVANTYCDGTNFTCPALNYKPDNTPCINNGRCKTGTCESPCGNFGSCVCGDPYSCQVCCISSTNSSACLPLPQVIPNAQALNLQVRLHYFVNI